MLKNKTKKIFLFSVIIWGIKKFFFTTFVWAAGNDLTLPNPLGSKANDPRVVIGNTIKAAMSVVGSLALAMFVYGGFIWLLSGGSPEKVNKGKKILVWAFIGLVIIFSSYSILNFILGTKGGFLAPFLAF